MPRGKPRTQLPSETVNALFNTKVAGPAQPSSKQVFVCRQERGPKDHEDLIIRAASGPDAHRQYFNYYGLHEQTWRYRLKLVVIGDDHELAKQAIECQTPRDPNMMTGLQQQIDAQVSEVEEAIKSGGAQYAGSA